jgi:hypothetical protein
MYAVRRWSVRHARGLEIFYDAFEWVVVALHPLWKRIGYERLEPSGLGGSLGLQIIAAVARLAALPFLEVGIGAGTAGPHRGRINGLLEALRELHLRGLATATGNDLRGDVAPADDAQASHDPPQAAARRAAIRLFAVSTAVPASRQ